MSNYSITDREFLQTLLASAFVVQQSPMDSQSLSAIVEAEQLIMTGEVDGDGAKHLIVDRTRNGANATGIAIGLSSGVQVSSPGLEEDDRRSGAFLPHLASTLSAHGTGAVSADFALDLVLNDIVEQARLATNASAAAIALMRGEEMVCRATTGKNAPEQGVRLYARSELSGDRTQSSKAQCCDDTEADSRVDVVACRRLGIRSFLIFPVLRDGELVGLFEIFSPRPKAFGDPDIQTLEALSQQILINVDCAIEFSTPPPKEEPRTAADSMEACFASFGVRPPEVKTAPFRFRDPWTQLLVILVSALALLLGWMLVLVTWRGTAHTKGPPPLVSAKPDAAPAQPEENRQADPSPPPPIPPKARSPEAPSDSLVVYQNGKVIFRLKPSQEVGPSRPKSGDTIPDPSQAPGQPSAADPALGSSGKANVELLQRVEPEYPEAARQQHIQGPVVLEAKVGKDGAVQELTVISGNSTLATAASDAVLQWRFNPLVQNGRAVQFQTRIRVDFVLP
jgi:TonB family protein